MPISELTAAIVVFSTLIALSWLNQKVLNVVLFTFFMFIYVKLSQEYMMVATFYALFFLFYWTVFLAKEEFAPDVETNEAGVFGTTISGQPFFLFTIFIGFMLYLMIKILSVKTGFRIIATPPLLISWEFLKPSVSIVLAFVENRVFITLYEVQNMFYSAVGGFTGKVIAIVATGGLFSLFHNFMGAGTFLWAFIVMCIWIIVYDDELMGFGMRPLDLSHGLNNMIVELNF